MTDPIESLEHAVRLSPENVPLRMYLAELLAEKGYSSRALEHYRACAAAEPGSIPVGLGLGKTLLEQGDAAAAVKVLNQALGMDPDPAQAGKLHVELSRALLALGEDADAREHYRNGLRSDPASANRDLAERLYRGSGGLSAAEDTSDEPGPGRPQRLRANDVPDLPGVPVEAAGMNFGDVGGMDALKEVLRLSIVYPFQNPEIYRAYGRGFGGGILLYGPPGCGKTYIARATAGEIQAGFLAVGLSDIMDMWWGESERKLHEFFETVRRQAPAVLFFDEVEALGHSRTRMTGSNPGRTLVNQFLAEMDGIHSRNENLLIVGATNSPWDLDPAFRRPGRFDRVIFVAPPDQPARVEILKLHTRDKPTETIDYERIAARTDRFSGADLRAVCETAAERALEEALRTRQIRKITTADFMEALKRVKPSTTEWLDTAQNYARYSNKSGLYNDVVEYLGRSK